MFDIYLSKVAISPQLAARAMEARRLQSKSLAESGFSAEAKKNLSEDAFKRYADKPGFSWSSFKSKLFPGNQAPISKARARRLGLAPKSDAGFLESAKMHARGALVPMAAGAKGYLKHLPLTAGIALTGYGISRGLSAPTQQSYNTSEEYQNR